MKKIFTLLSLSIALSFTAGAANATYGWFLAGGGTGSDYAADVVTDANGNIFMASSFIGSATFNGVTLTGSAKGSGTSADKSLFISKIAPNKTNLWNIYSNVGVINPTAMATTTTGDLIVTGTMRAVKGGATTSANIVDAAGTATVFTDLGYQGNDIQSFVAKFNSSGIVQWVKELNSSATKDTLVETAGLATDANGNVYVTGTFSKTVILPAATPVTLTSTNATLASFIAKLDGATGNTIWNKTTSGGIESERFAGLAFDNGYLYIAGNIRNNLTTPISVTIGDKSFTPTKAADLTLVKMDANGTISYIQERQNLAIDSTKDIKVKDMIVKDGRVFIAGSFNKTASIKFATDTISSTSAFLNGFLAAFNTTDGTDLWQKSLISPAIAEFYGVAVGKDNNIYTFGSHYNGLGTVIGDVDFGDGVKLTDATNKMGDLFLAGYDAVSGTTKEVHLVAKGTSSEAAIAMTSYDDKLYLAGTVKSSPTTFENNATYSTTSFDFALISYTVSNASSIDNQKEVSTFAYYDKANQAIVLKNAENVASVKIYDMTGRLVKAVTEKEDVSKINAQSIHAGIFIVQTSTVNGQTASYKVAIN